MLKVFSFIRSNLKWLLAFAAVFMLVFVVGVYDFLAVNRPVPGANVLVVEGWLWKSTAVAEAADIFKQGHYDWVVTVGEPNEDDAAEAGADAGKSTAELVATKLKAMQVDEARIIQLPVAEVEEHQTYTCALYVRKWLAESKFKITGIDVFSLGTHARKSWVLFEKALGKHVPVGIFAGTEHTFNPKSWWASPRGIYVIAKKTLGYLYAVFWPFPNQGEQ